MSPLEVDSQRSRIMRSVRQVGTKPETSVRRWLHAKGYRFRTNVRGLPGSPDIVFTRRKKVIFVHGCFWHRHPGCRLASMPKTRTVFWTEKFVRNLERDKRKNEELADDGWLVLTVWECEIRRINEISACIERFLGPPRLPRSSHTVVDILEAHHTSPL